jgi:hypothetical protein
MNKTFTQLIRKTFPVVTSKIQEVCCDPFHTSRTNNYKNELATAISFSFIPNLIFMKKISPFLLFVLNFLVFSKNGMGQPSSLLRAKPAIASRSQQSLPIILSNLSDIVFLDRIKI